MNKQGIWPAILMMIGGLILAISPWVSLVDSSVAPFDNKPVEGAWVVVVEETGDRNLSVAKIAADGEFWQSLEKRGVQWRFYDVDSADAKSYVAPAKKAGIPAILILNSTGKVLEAKPLPDSTSGIDAIVKRVVRK